ncbi:Dabb family protein [Actinomadura rupiterrae]|uniref:Dabb family protein n=1 Tax=Actinomadura rupiterrae TaxID=559627 RepID=UPI0020A38C01|nr:Dabb family protein [Actinomadura rupiterrae]MCP2339608.1 quinol monooxygenase YgiN [Actinomadura rupiterrae]
MTGFRHVVLLTWIEGTTTAQVGEVAARLRELPGVVPEIRGYSVGPDAGVNPGTADFAIVADFADRDAYVAYRDNPTHRAVVDAMKPLIASRASVQYEL